MGHEYGGYNYLEMAEHEPLLRSGDIDLNRTFNLMRQQQRIERKSSSWWLNQQCNSNSYATKEMNSESLFASLFGSNYRIVRCEYGNGNLFDPRNHNI